MSKHPPAFQMYPADWLADENVSAMTAAQEGFYIRAICFCWREGTIPSDPARLAAMLGKGCTEADAAIVQECFTAMPNHPSRMVHMRLEEEREKQLEWSAKSSAGGKRSAQIRRERAKARILSQGSELKGGSDLVRTKREPKGNISSTSTSIDTDPPISPPSKKRKTKYRNFDPLDFNWPPKWGEQAKAGMKTWVEYKSESGKATLLSSYQDIVDHYADRPREFVADMSFSKRSGYTGLVPDPNRGATNGNGHRKGAVNENGYSESFLRNVALTEKIRLEEEAEERSKGHV